MPRRYLAALPILVLLACGDDDDRTSSGALTGITGVTTLTAGDGSTGGQVTTGEELPDGSTGAEDPPPPPGTEEAGEDSDPGAIKLDVGGSAEEDGEDPPPPAEGGCTKVDFLFVIDNSGSMADEQHNLIESFPGFIDTITSTIDAGDFHIMTVSTDGGEGNGGGEVQCDGSDCVCEPAPSCCELACQFGSSCNGVACDDLPPVDECTYEYGSGKRYSGEGTDCELAGGRRWMTDAQPNLAQSFQCAAAVGAYGSGDEKPMLAAREACGSGQNGPGGCDEGFLRDDAILVLTVITDEEDDNLDDLGSPGDPPDWYADIVAAKGGDASAIVVLGLVGDSNLPNGLCEPGVDPNVDEDGAEASPRLQSFVQMFPHGVVGSVCAPDYTPFFAEAVSVIDFACDEFIPPG